eukprot:COSAG02_NODE_5025_length_4719_cov_7.779654_6_plen_221_part_00
MRQATTEQLQLQPQTDRHRHHEQRQRRAQRRDEDEDSLGDEAEQEDFNRAAVTYTTRISGGKHVFDRGMRTQPRQASARGARSSPGRDEQQAYVHAQESGAGRSLVLSPAAPWTMYSEGGRHATSRLTVGDLRDQPTRRGGYDSPLHLEEQPYVPSRHAPGSHAVVHGADRLQSRRSNPSMRDRTHGESRDSSIAFHARDAAGGGSDGGVSSEVRTAFSA